MEKAFQYLKTIVIFSSIGLLTLCLLLGLFFIGLPQISLLQNSHPVSWAYMELSKKNDPEKKIQYMWVDLDQISPTLIKSVIVSEDDTFYQHHGFNWIQIRKAFIKNWQSGTFVRGASTISQQLIKNLYLSPDKNPLRKIREAILTYQMEKILKKDRILEIYLNIVEWGPSTFGAEAASQHYFHKSARYLSAYEAAYLASILPNPNRLTAKKMTHIRQSRINGILKKMAHYPLPLLK